MERTRIKSGLTALALSAALLVASSGAVAPRERVASTGEGFDLSALLVSTAEAAGYTYVLKVDGIAGESTVTNHQGEIDALGYSWAETAPIDPATGSTTGKAIIAGLTVNAKMSKASPLLFKAVATSQLIAAATLTGSTPTTKGPVDNLWFRLSGVKVIEYETTSELVERYSLAFTKLTIEYKPVSADGKLGTSTITDITVASTAQ
ncbi:MAG: type VI secretion system tube protein Hcp [Chloroflexota bacterium]